VLTSPASIFVKVVGNIAFLQFPEDSYATASSFHEGATWIAQTEADDEPLQV
jgi:hypothetical protein